MRHSRVALALLFALCVCAPTGVSAGEAALSAENPELEARVQRIAEELRCLVCQNQTIADSNADLAKPASRSWDSRKN